MATVKITLRDCKGKGNKIEVTVDSDPPFPGPAVPELPTTAQATAFLMLNALNESGRRSPKKPRAGAPARA